MKLVFLTADQVYVTPNRAANPCEVSADPDLATLEVSAQMASSLTSIRLPPYALILNPYEVYPDTLRIIQALSRLSHQPLVLVSSEFCGRGDMGRLLRTVCLLFLQRARDSADLSTPQLRLGQIGLTNNQEQVLRGVCQYKTNREIAAELNITLKTVEYHITGILNRLGVSSRREAARWAMENCVWDQEALHEGRNN
ncbi:MAG: hypothetical protein IT317_05185 [Anaerolineales bacterium]|nr:hypothetical protein [Anaerolineales bacterium]